MENLIKFLAVSVALIIPPILIYGLVFIDEGYPNGFIWVLLVIPLLLVVLGITMIIFLIRVIWIAVQTRAIFTKEFWLN